MPWSLGLDGSGYSRGYPKFVHLWNPQILSPMFAGMDLCGSACSHAPQILSPFISPNPFTKRVQPTVSCVAPGLYSRVALPKSVHPRHPQILSPLGFAGGAPNPFTKAPNPQPLGPNGFHRSPKSTTGVPQWCSPNPQIYAPYDRQSLTGLGFPEPKCCLKV